MSLRENINITLAQGEIIDYNTKGIDSEDRDHLLGERKSAYNVEHMNPTLEKYIRVEKSHFRPRYILTVICPFLSILFIGLFRGNNTIDSIVGVEVCSAWYFILLGVQVIVLALLGLINVLILRKEYREKIECGYQFVSGDVIWDDNTTTKFVIFALIAGFVSGSVGFSRGVLFTPLFIDFGIPPTVASSTSMYMATFATLSSSILFMMSGYIIYDVVFYLSAFAIIGTILGTTIVSQKIRKSGNVAILIWLIATVNLLSCIAEIIVGIVRIIDKNNRKDEIWDFTTPC
ncbi:unnamed protein product [Moneuplotes crassus]|uniref:Sulfite exporter TauE/SafE family protein n=1 Tax=Euplotes crassus TaxID=5936 RepID=A0AAD1U2V4_EUPCR|nr:unnamed protein product [Moneuplotes crassus]